MLDVVFVVEGCGDWFVLEGNFFEVEFVGYLY